MDKRNWYRNRILWKANQHDLFSKGCCQFSELSESQVLIIKDSISRDIDPVLVFWESENRWTVLGTSEVCSFYSDTLVCSYLDEINKKVTLSRSGTSSQESVKTEASYIRLDCVDKVIWAPPGASLFALMNILKMFPIRKRADLN